MEPKQKSLAVLSPTYKVYLPSSLKSQWKPWNMVESVDIDNQSGFFICVHTWCKTCPFSHNVDNFFGSKQSLKITLSFMCTSINAFMINVGETGRKLPPTIFINIFNFWRKETKMHQNHIKLGAISSENMSAKQ